MTMKVRKREKPLIQPTEQSGNMLYTTISCVEPQSDRIFDMAHGVRHKAIRSTNRGIRGGPTDRHEFSAYDSIIFSLCLTP